MWRGVEWLMRAYMLKGKTLAAYYGIYARRADAEARLGSLDLARQGYRVVRVVVTEFGKDSRSRSRLQNERGGR